MPTTTEISYHDVLVERSERGYYGSGSGHYHWSETKFDPPTRVAKSVITRGWDRTPNYRSIKSSGGALPENNLSYSRWETSPAPFGSFSSSSNPGAGYWDVGFIERSFRQSICPGYVPDMRIPQEAWTLATAKALEAAKGNSWSAPVFAAEARSTAAMVTSAAERIVGTAVALKRGRFVDVARDLGLVIPTKTDRRRFSRHHAKDPTRTAASAWLEMRYGWLPFMSDAHSATMTLMDSLEREDTQTSTVKVGAYGDFSTSDPVSVFMVSPAVFGPQEEVRQCTHRILLKCKPASGALPGSFGLLNPAAVAWELTPLSFVGDWFFSIGDYLNGLDTDLRIQFVSGATSVKMKYSKSGFVTTPGWYGSYSTSGVAVERTRSFSLPQLSIRDAFRPKCELNTKRLLDSAALLRTIFLK